MTKVDINEMNATLKKFHNLHRLFNEISEVKKIYSYPYKKAGIMEEEYNFYGILNSPSEGWKLEFLARLESLITELGDVYSDNDVKNGLLNNPFSFKSEMEFALFCKQNGIKIVEKEPRLKSGKRLDFLINIGSHDALVEIITPRPKAEMVRKKVGFFPMSGEVEYNIFAEFKRHEIKKNDINQPFLIVIDPIYSAVDEINIQCAIEEFQKKFKGISPYLCGVLLMRAKRFNAITSEEIGGYQFFKNLNSKNKVDLEKFLTKNV